MWTHPGSWHLQGTYDVRFEWGTAGAHSLSADSDVVIVVDVLRFTTAVEAANASGVTVYPCRWKDERASEMAESVGALLADSSDPDGPSLSPRSLARLSRGSKVVLPSPNGATCSLTASASGAMVMAACLRNARAVAERALRDHATITVIACGERWPDGSLRPSIEDLVGAGAVISWLPGNRSPEADTAASVFSSAARRLGDLMAACASGREALAMGWIDDLRYASELDVSDIVPALIDGAYRAS
jgi:2-phosphosulfolactate phosphatase